LSCDTPNSVAVPADWPNSDVVGGAEPKRLPGAPNNDGVLDYPKSEVYGVVVVLLPNKPGAGPPNKDV
jgi:hypothetical protein